jgi:hypothetical protein
LNKIMQSNSENQIEAGVVFQIRFIDADSDQESQVVLNATDSSNRIISFEVLASQLQQLWANGDDFVIKHGAKHVKSDQDVFSAVYGATMKGERIIDLIVETSRNEWDFVETASQLSDDDNVSNRSKTKHATPPEAIEEINHQVADRNERNSSSLSMVAKQQEECKSAQPMLSGENKELVTQNAVENVEDQNHEEKLSPCEEENMLMSMEERILQPEETALEKLQARSIEQEKEARDDSQESIRECAIEESKVVSGMPTQSVFDGSQISLNFDILSEDLSTSSFPLGEWDGNAMAAKRHEGPQSFDYPAWIEKNQDVGCLESPKPENVMSFASWEEEHGNVKNEAESKSIEESLRNLEKFLNSDNNPNELKLRKLLSLLNSVIEEILLKTSQNPSWDLKIKEILGETGDESFLSALKQLASNPRVVRELQNAFSSDSVRNLVVDIALNDVSTIDDLRKIVISHLGDILTTVGEVFREAPQALSILPYILKWFISFLYDENEKPNDNEEKHVHSGVLCDGCDDNERKSLAMINGTISGAYICGIRYKSAVRDDFDLCETCEASGIFEDEYGPFLKIRTPAKAPREIVCVLNAASFDTAESELYEPVDPAPNVSIDERNELRCPKGNHPLSSFMVPNRLFACDVCNSTPHRGSVMYGCRICDWDICRNCVEEKYPELSAAGNAVAYGKAPSVQAPASRSSVRPRATFVADVNFQDGSVLQPGTHFTKIWRVENSSKDIAWPNQCRIVCVGGDLMGATPSGFLVPPLPPKQVGDICVQLIAPRNPGRYIGYWRLVTPQNERFGQRFWVDVTVENVGSRRDSENDTVTQRVAVADVDLDKWALELQQLANMEFLDCEKNVALLEQFKGNLEEVINSLLSKY